jgi:hypothetical protein
MCGRPACPHALACRDAKKNFWSPDKDEWVRRDSELVQVVAYATETGWDYVVRARVGRKWMGMLARLEDLRPLTPLEQLALQGKGTAPSSVERRSKT